LVRFVGVIHRYLRGGRCRVVVAIDNPRIDLQSVREVIKSTSEYTDCFKIGLPYIVSKGIRQVGAVVKEFSDKYFIADLKLADVGFVMSMAAEEVARYGFDAVVAHAFVGYNEALDELVKKVRELELDLILQTSMTHNGSSSTIDRLVPEIKAVINAVNPDGVIAPANKPERIRELRESFGWGLAILAPGIMSKSVRPGEALCAGADAEIIGRWIVTSPNPASALRRILELQDQYLSENRGKCIERS